VLTGRKSVETKLIHGLVLMANHPATVIRKGAERKGILAA
jgi:hypothetical protein